MKSIGDLLCRGRSEGRPFGIEATPITGDRYHLRMILQPFRKALAGPVRQQINDAVKIQVDQDRAVVLTFAPSPVVDAEIADRNSPFRRGPFEAAQDGIVADDNGQSGEQSLAW